MDALKRQIAAKKAELDRLWFLFLALLFLAPNLMKKLRRTYSGKNEVV